MLAITLGVVGYLVALSLRQEPVTPVAHAQLSELPHLRDPKRLDRRPSFVPAAAQRDVFPPELRAVEIAVRELPAELRATAGVGVFDKDDHEVAWLPLRAATERDGALVVSTNAPAAQRLRIVVAAELATARTGYWSSIEWPADAPTDRKAELNASVHTVTVRCIDEDKAVASLLRLRRAEDPRWAPRTAYPSGLAVGADRTIALRLGAGLYELAPWAEGEHASVAIEVPGPSTIDAKFAR